jgi:hypothetical protein
METTQGTRIEPAVRMSRGDDPRPLINLVPGAATHSWWLQWVDRAVFFECISCLVILQNSPRK